MERENDFCTFAHWHRTSGDIDPVYPVLGCIGGYLCDDEDDLISLILLYVAYYNIASALTAWLDGWRPGKELSNDELRYPTGTERRGHRTIQRFAEHIAGLGLLHRKWGSWEKALWPVDAADPARRWTVLQWYLMDIRGNGRWAAYKTGEMLKVIAEWDVQPTDAGHAYSSGPRKGLVDLFPELVDKNGNDDYTTAILDERTQRLVELLGQPVEQVETALCDWHSVLRGHYYVGHDIDQMQTQIAWASPQVRSIILSARNDAFEPRWLGEAMGWEGVRKKLNDLYRTTGVIEWWQ